MDAFEAAETEHEKYKEHACTAFRNIASELLGDIEAMDRRPGEVFYAKIGNTEQLDAPEPAIIFSTPDTARAYVGFTFRGRSLSFDVHITIVDPGRSVRVETLGFPSALIDVQTAGSMRPVVDAMLTVALGAVPHLAMMEDIERERWRICFNVDTAN